LVLCGTLSRSQGALSSVSQERLTLLNGEAVEIVRKCNGTREVLSDFRKSLFFLTYCAEHPVR
jgi:hypothetical protein